MTNHLLRDRAPISTDTWNLLDAEAAQRLTVALGGRKIVDLIGPHGWEHSAVNLGRVGPPIVAPIPRVKARTRRVLPLTETRADFLLSPDELMDATRGAVDIDLTPLDEAAHRIASVENAAIFHGWDEAGINGILPRSPHQPLSGTNSGYDDVVASAVDTLKNAGVDGPYALALGPESWTTIIEATGTGYPLVRHLREILGGPIEWVPGLDAAAVVSQRGGDFLLDIGEDLALGYDPTSNEDVALYLEESFTFHVATPEAAIEIRVTDLLI